MEVQDLKWEEIEEGFRHLGIEDENTDSAAAVPVLHLETFMPLLRKAYDKESDKDGSVGFMKMQYGPGEVIAHRSGYTSFAAIILSGKLRILFGFEGIGAGGALNRFAAGAGGCSCGMHPTMKRSNKSDLLNRLPACSFSFLGFSG